MLDFINNALDKINKENKYCLLLGDFNIDLSLIHTQELITLLIL